MTFDNLESEQPKTSRQESQGLLSASQQATLSEARKRLEEDVIEFLLKMKNGGESELGHIPGSQDLIPFFQRYALSVIEMRNKEKIVNAGSISEARALIHNAVDVAVMTICKRGKTVHGKRKHAGVWFPTIKHACKAVNLGWWTTKYGTYDKTAFSRPPHVQLREFLLVQMQALETEFWNRKAIQDQSVPWVDPIAPIADSSADPITAVDSPTDAMPDAASAVKRHFPARAKWLKDRLYERGWSPQEFENKGGPHRTTTTRKLLKGLPVRPMTLEKVAEALTMKKPAVSPAEIPND